MFDHILVPLDGSLVAECVLPYALAVAKPFDAQIDLLQVLEKNDLPGQIKAFDPFDWEISRAEAASYLQHVGGNLKLLGFQAVSFIDEGRAADRIIQFAHRQSINLIALSSHGRSGLSGWNISSVVQKVISRSYISTLLVPAYQPACAELFSLRFHKILVALDCSKRAECVLPLALSLASFHQASLLLAHVVSRPELPHHVPINQEDLAAVKHIVRRNEQEAAQYLDQLCSRHSFQNLDIQMRLVVSENAAEALHELVDEEKVSLVILCAHGYSGGSKWPYGSMALSFIAYGMTPLFILQDLALNRVQPTRAEAVAGEHAGH